MRLKPTAHLDILMRQSDGSFIWLEATNDLEAAKNRLQELSAANPGNYFVFDQRAQQIVANIGTVPQAADNGESPA